MSSFELNHRSCRWPERPPRTSSLGGARIKAGDKVLLSFAGANRDPAEFHDPDRLDLDRERNRHLAFGAGPHRCIGSHLARLNITIALQQLLTRLPDIHFAPGAGVSHDIGFRRGIRSVPVEFTPGRRVTRVAG